MDVQLNRWKGFWKVDKNDTHTFSHIVDILISKHGWTHVPCYVKKDEKRNYEYKVSNI